MNDLAEALKRYEGRTFLGCFVAAGHTEFVFAGGYPNLLTFFNDGEVGHGEINDPESYAERAAQR